MTPVGPKRVFQIAGSSGKMMLMKESICSTNVSSTQSSVVVCLRAIG